MTRVRLRILLVDDDATVRRSLGRCLATEHEVLLAASAAEALAFVAATELDLVLSDYDLRDTHDGIWLLERIRESHPHVRRMLTSGDPLVDGEGLDLERFWRKPVDTLALLAYLR